MHAVRRLSMPLARLFNHEDIISTRQGSLAPPPGEPDHPAPTESSASDQPIARSLPTASLGLEQVASHPAISTSSVADADLPLMLQDAVYVYQLSQSTPLRLSPIAFHTADIVWRYKDSERVYNVLQKRGIITQQGEIRTAAISNRFAHQFAFLSGFAQRRIIGLLFWWEEEEQRMKHLMEQGQDISDALSHLQDGQDRAMRQLLMIELERTKMLIKQKPSARYSDTASARTREQLPAYVPPPPGSSRERLPMYTEDPTTFITA